MNESRYTSVVLVIMIFLMVLAVFSTRLNKDASIPTSTLTETVKAQSNKATSIADELKEDKKGKKDRENEF